MTNEEYAKFVEKMAPSNLVHPICKRPTLDHAVKGICAEAGEIMEIIKALQYYGRPVSEQHLLEEIGDLYFYTILLANSLGYTIDDIVAANVAKLKARYPEGFSTERANNRNRENEQRAIANCQ